MGGYLSKSKEIPDSQWKEQNKASNENPMYQFAHLEKGGRLISAYEQDDQQKGREAVIKMAREEIISYLYEDGGGSLVTDVVHRQWLMGCLKKNEKEAKSDQEENCFEEHLACWNLKKRGAMGETPLHLLYLMKKIEIAEILLEIYPKLALDFYEGPEYYGESSLHLAIVTGDLESVKFLIKRGADIKQRASGRFFLPKDQVKKRTGRTNYEGYAYYGEYPLAFAACLGYTDIYDFLIEKGADPDMRDSFGNTVLHMVVISDQVDMYKYVARHHKKSANCNIPNDAGLTPLTLACKLGRHNVFKEIIELESEEYWRYGNIMCSAYPIDDLDSIGEEGEINTNSALMLIIEGETDEHLEMLQGGVIRQLLDEKWKEFVKFRFYILLLVATVYLMLISIAVYTRPAGDLRTYSSPIDGGRFFCESLISVVCFVIIIYTCSKVFFRGNTLVNKHEKEDKSRSSTPWKVHFRSILRSCQHAPALTIYIVSCFLIVLCFPMRFAGIRDAEDYLLIFAVPSAWFSLLFFARGIELTGPFVTMIYKMFVGDLFRFGIIYLIFLIGFAQAFYFLFDNLSSGVNNNSETFADTLMTLFQMTLGEFKYRDFDVTRYSVLTKIVFAAFMILVPILLLNMLIAMMGNTYQQVISKSEKEWRKQWAKMVVTLERIFNTDKRLKDYQAKYCVKRPQPQQSDDDHDDSDDKKPKKVRERRALVVIKSCSKTKAKQRKGAITNWKKTGKEIIRQVKQQKREGKAGAFELHRRRSGQSDEDGATFSQTVKQLAWQKDIDIDLSESHSFVEDNKSQEKEKTHISNLPNGKKQVKVPPGKPQSSPNTAKMLEYVRVPPLTEHDKRTENSEVDFGKSISPSVSSLPQVEEPQQDYACSLRAVNFDVKERKTSDSSWDSSNSIHKPSDDLLISVPKQSLQESSVLSHSGQGKQTEPRVRFGKPHKKVSHSDEIPPEDIVLRTGPVSDTQDSISESEI